MQRRAYELVLEKPEGCTRLFVGNCAWAIEDGDIEQLFGQENITGIRWSTDRETGQFRGFGHVTFVSTEAVDAAAAKNGTVIKGRPIRVDYAADKKSY